MKRKAKPTHQTLSITRLLIDLSGAELHRVGEVTRLDDDEIVAYIMPGWCIGKRGEHLATGPVAAVTKEIRMAQRCYCAACCNPKEWGGTNVAGVPAAHEVVRLRMLVAKANKIPLTGKPHHEAKIDAALEET